MEHTSENQTSPDDVIDPGLQALDSHIKRAARWVGIFFPVNLILLISIIRKSVPTLDPKWLLVSLYAVLPLAWFYRRQKNRKRAAELAGESSLTDPYASLEKSKRSVDLMKASLILIFIVQLVIYLNLPHS